jgi:DNA-binding NarL/FixJ family response regulator
VTRILIVDDHPIALGGIRATLGAAVPGGVFGEANTVPAALTALQRERWDLLLLDLGLPPPGGLELLKDVHHRLPDLKVLVVSAFAEEEFAVVCMRNGAAGYVAKTSGAAELRAAVLKILSGGRYVSASLAELLADQLAKPESEATIDALSTRELQVLKAVASGQSGKEIAAALGVSERTVGTYRTRITEKLGLRSAVEIARYAMRHRLID